MFFYFLGIYRFKNSTNKCYWLMNLSALSFDNLAHNALQSAALKLPAH